MNPHGIYVMWMCPTCGRLNGLTYPYTVSPINNDHAWECGGEDRWESAASTRKISSTHSPTVAVPIYTECISQ